MDYFEQKMREIIEVVLIRLAVGDADNVATAIAHALREQGYTQSTGIGGPAEYARSVE